jgi:hypothetical protein
MASPALPSIGSAMLVFPFHFSGQFNASKTNLAKFNAPFDMQLLYANCSIQAKGGTQGTTTLQVKHAGNGVTNAMDIGTPAAATVVEATLTPSEQDVDKDGAVSVDLVITGGASPTIDNISLLLVYQRRG